MKLPYQQEAGQEANTKTCSNGQTTIANLGSNGLQQTGCPNPEGFSG